ncbi:MAG: methylmalonyl Co-A mutase-associated GTPase MeaB [Planctomycetes bacterium]|nr:methylmalonyl Co-A mutase-associated GTPase MeaB [Planctomycetota bacterium]
MASASRRWITGKMPVPLVLEQMNESIEKLIAGIASGDRRSLSKAISAVENENELAAELMSKLSSKTNSYRIGITGPPGTGKSTLTSNIADVLSKDKGVGILAIDPSSVRSGGALLGDRVRMTKLTLAKNVYIRSMAGRGALGGIASGCDDVCALYEAFGFDYTIVETIGVGQDEVEIRDVADTVVLVLNPAAGDGVQTLKGGVLEIADIIVVNKADLSGADAIAGLLEESLHLRSRPGKWQVPVLKSVATKDDGTAQIVEQIARHREFVTTNEGAREIAKTRLQARILKKASTDLVRRALSISGTFEKLETLAGEVALKSKSLRDAAKEFEAILWDARRS